MSHTSAGVLSLNTGHINNNELFCMILLTGLKVSELNTVSACKVQTVHVLRKSQIINSALDQLVNNCQ